MSVRVGRNKSLLFAKTRELNIFYFASRQNLLQKNECGHVNLLKDGMSRFEISSVCGKICFANYVDVPEMTAGLLAVMIYEL